MLQSNSLLTLEPAPTEVQLPFSTDLVGYESLVSFIQKEGVGRIEGDFLEIGCFLGGGTAKLARLAAATGKIVWVIDVFNPGFDHTRNLSGDSMASLYQRYLNSSSQEEIFRLVTKPWTTRIRVIKEDSMRVRLPKELRLAFGFVDGNHDSAWAKSDFGLVWRHLAAGGWAGFHDYGGDLPEVTAALDMMMQEYAAEIERIEKIKEKWVLLVKKRTP